MKLRFEGVNVKIPKGWVEVRQEGGLFRPWLCFDSPAWEPVAGPKAYTSEEVARARGETALAYAIGKLAETCN